MLIRSPYLPLIKVFVKLTVSRKTAKKLAVRRKNWQIVTASRKRVNCKKNLWWQQWKDINR